MIGQAVGNYVITGLLGEGGMGAVYLAEHPGIGRKAAVKLLHPDLARSEEIVSRFFNEARAANAIRHPGIVEVFDFGTLPTGASYIVMEFLEGQSLAARLKRSRLSIAEAVDFAVQATSALGAAHAKSIVHRDLKPDNLYLVPDPSRPGHDTVKVLDFGIAKLGAGPMGGGSVRTRTGALMGTPIYMSPEQCRGTKEIDHRTDIYALGIILYEMLCGRPPFVSEGHGELIHFHISAAPPPLRSFNPTVPPELEQVVLRALAKDPGQRPQSMAELQAALQGAPLRPLGTARLDGRPPSLTDLRPTGPAPMTTFSGTAGVVQRSSFRPLSVMVVLLGLGGGVGGFLYWQRQKVEPPVPAARPPVETPPVVAPPPAPVPPPAKMIAVDITSDPASARVLREADGAVLGLTPFHESRPAGRGVEKLRLEAEGYRSEPLIVPLDRGVTLRIDLHKVSAPPPVHPPAKVKHGKLPARPPVTSPASPPPPPPPPPPRVEPPKPKEPVPI